MVDLTEIRKKAVSATECIESLDEPFQKRFIEQKKIYRLQTGTVEQLKKLRERYVVVAFSATWCTRAIAGNELGRIVETPKLLPTLEQELLEIIKTRHACA